MNKYPKIIMDDINNSPINMVNKITVEQYYDFMHHTHKMSDIVNDIGSVGNGSNGKSAYEIWLSLGNVGTEEDFIDSLKGKDAVDIRTNDEKVKLTSSSIDEKYLADLIDNSTIKVDTDNDVIYIEKISGQTVTVAEINLLKGATSNIQDQINKLNKFTSIYGVFNTKADLIASTDPTPLDGNIAIVLEDKDNNGNKTTYIYIESSSEWVHMGDCSIEVRDFSTNPINLSTEVTDVLPESNIDPSIARLVNVLDKNTYKGSADGVVKSADALVGLKYTTEELNNAIDNSHIHKNKELLDKLISYGDGNKYLTDNGEYKDIITISSEVPENTKLWIDISDPENAVLKVYDEDWITTGGASTSSVIVDSKMSDSSINQVQNKVIKEYIDDKMVIESLMLAGREW